MSSSRSYGWCRIGALREKLQADELLTKPMSRFPAPRKTLSLHRFLRYNILMTHAALVRLAEQWLRTRYRCGIVLSEQSCASGETPDVIAWKGKCRSVVVECKVSRADFFADQEKPFRKDPELAMGCERFYLVPQGLVTAQELPHKWGLLESKGREVRWPACAALKCALSRRPLPIFSNGRTA
jgi:hypothetical protein